MENESYAVQETPNRKGRDREFQQFLSFSLRYYIHRFEKDTIRLPPGNTPGNSCAVRFFCGTSLKIFSRDHIYSLFIFVDIQHTRPYCRCRFWNGPLRVICKSSIIISSVTHGVPTIAAVSAHICLSAEISDGGNCVRNITSVDRPVQVEAERTIILIEDDKLFGILLCHQIIGSDRPVLGITAFYEIPESVKLVLKQ